MTGDIKNWKDVWNEKTFFDYKYKESNLMIHFIGSIYLKNKISSMITS